MRKNPIRILLVDDNTVTRSLLRGILRGDEYEVVGEASDGGQGLELALRLQPEIICLDIEIPGTSGLDMLPKLREQLPNTVVLMVTGHTDREMVQAAVQGGAAGYIIKPFNAAKVLDNLSSALNKVRARL